ncbi:MAG: cytochrome c3 family protein [Arhodomonas sp.]|nr:cytochrome c3 family protein [Arhodomonas sp.]
MGAHRGPARRGRARSARHASAMERGAAAPAHGQQRLRHEDHGSVRCTTCHHDFAEATGTGGSCMNCHVTDARTRRQLREDFHGLCMGCHRERATAGENAGPLRRCSGCHISEGSTGQNWIGDTMH